jgi:hypothetical protein
MTLNDDEYIRHFEPEVAIKYIAEQTGNKYEAETPFTWIGIRCNFPFDAPDGRRYSKCLWYNRNSNAFFVRIATGETLILGNEKISKVISIIKKIETDVKKFKMELRKKALKEDFQ